MREIELRSSCLQSKYRTHGTLSQDPFLGVSHSFAGLLHVEGRVQTLPLFICLQDWASGRGAERQNEPDSLGTHSGIILIWYEVHWSLRTVFGVGVALGPYQVLTS